MAKNGTVSPTHMLKHSMVHSSHNGKSPRLRKRGTFNGFAATHLSVAGTVQKDTVIDEEDTACPLTFQFKRIPPVKRSKRRHTMLHVSTSLPGPGAVNSLSVPRDYRSYSLPGGSLCSADAMDSEAVARLQQIRRAHLSASHGKLPLVQCHECQA